MCGQRRQEWGVGGVSHLPLTDIAHREPNPVTEWRMVRIGFGVIIVALVVGVATLVRVVLAAVTPPTR